MTTLTVSGVPAAYVPLFVKAGKTCPEVSAALLAAQAKHESQFNPRATSHAGAQGISQFIPSTWKQYGHGSVWNPSDAIPAQGRYMCQLAKNTARFPGDRTALMLSAYNAGPAAVEKYGGVPPFSETIKYINRIKGEMK